MIGTSIEDSSVMYESLKAGHPVVVQEKPTLADCLLGGLGVNNKYTFKMKADVVDIFTDVPGVAIIDPRVIPSVSYIKEITYSDMYKLAENGAKVIHPRAVKAAWKFNIPVRVRSTFEKGEGTRICGEIAEDDRQIIGITLDKECTHIKDAKDAVCISVFFRPKFKDIIKDAVINKFVYSEFNIIDIIEYEEHITIVINKDSSVDCIKELYSLAQ